MQMGGLMGGFYRISEWILRLFYVNLLWVVFLFPGLIVFGLFPSTAAMFAVVRKWVRGEPDIAVFKTFWQSYKAEFIKSNLIGLVLVLITYVFYIDFQFIQLSTNGVVRTLHIPLLIIFFLSALISLYVFPVFVHYDVKIFQVFKNSFLLMIMFPLVTVSMVVTCLGVYWIMMRIPGLIPLFGGSLFAFVLTWGANLTFNRLEMKREEQDKAEQKLHASKDEEIDEYEQEIIEESMNNAEVKNN